MSNTLRECVVDFETVSACDLKASGSWRYAEDPTTDVLCLDFYLDGEWYGTWEPGDDPERFLELVTNERITFIAHGCGFEKAIWRRIMTVMFGWPDIPNSRWHDTMAVCAMKLIPMKMGMAVRVLRLPAEKDEEGSKFTIALSKPNKKGEYPAITPEVLERVKLYCRDDTKAQWGLHKRIGWLPPGERSVWLLDQRVNERGVKLDMEFVAAAKQVVEKASGPLLQEFQELTGLKTVGQTAKLGEWCAAKGVPIPNMQKETLARLLGTSEEDEDDGDDYSEEAEQVALPPDVHRALSIRQLIGSASIKKLYRMETCVCADGRARGLLQYHGAGPGRWAGRLLQPQNFPRGTLKDDTGEAPDPEVVVAAIMTGDPEYVGMLFGPPVETVVSSLRHAIIAEPDRQLVSGDFSKIEAIVVLCLAGEYEKALSVVNGDPYIDLARLVFGDPSIAKKTHPKERQIGKEGVLGSGFQMGWKKFRAQVFKKTGIMLSEEDAQRTIDTYRKQWAPGVPKVWYALEEAAVKCVWDRVPQEAYGVRYALEDAWMTARLPSGRKLWYPNPQPVRKAMPWDKTDVRPGFTYNAQKMGQWKEISAYGGLLTENVVQALARDLMCAAMFRLEKENFPVVLTVHDEILSEPLRKDVDMKAFKELMVAGTDWSRQMQIPVDSEVWSGDRYRK